MSDSNLPGLQSETRNPQPVAVEKEVREVNPFMTFDNGNRQRVDMEGATVEKVGRAPLTSDLTPPSAEEVVTNNGPGEDPTENTGSAPVVPQASGDDAKSQLPPD